MPRGMVQRREVPVVVTREGVGPWDVAFLSGSFPGLALPFVPGQEVAGIALADPTSPAEQRLRDTATREQLHAFFRALPATRFPALAVCGIHAWDGDRDQRFAASLDTLLRGIEVYRRPV